MQINDLPEFARVPVVAEALGISAAQVWRLVWAGDIPSVRLSERVVRIRRSDLVIWIETKAAASLA